MIYIISGISRSGKSTACSRLFDKIHVPYLPTDTIMMGVHNGFPSIGVNPETYSYEIAEKLWPLLKNMIICMIENEMDYIFEGEAFLAKDINELIKMYPNKIKACFIGYKNIDLDTKFQQIMKYSPKNDWFINNPDDYIKKHLSNMINLSTRIFDEATKNNIKYFDSSLSFENTVNDVVEYFQNKEID